MYNKTKSLWDKYRQDDLHTGRLHRGRDGAIAEVHKIELAPE